MLDKLLTTYFYCILRRPLLCVLALCLVAGALVSNLPNLKIDASSDALTLEYDKDLDFFREVSKRYQSGDFLVVTYTAQDDLFSAKSLAHLQKLKEELLAIDGIESANSILDVPLLYSPQVTFTEVSRGLKTLLDEGVDIDLAQKEFLNSPVYKDMLLGPDKKTTAILLNLILDNRFIELVRERDALRLQRDTSGLSSQESQRLAEVSAEFLSYSTAAAENSHLRVQKVREVVEQYRGDAQIFLGGVSMITADMVDFIRSDIIVFGAGIMIFIIILLTVIFRQWQFVLLPLLSCAFTLLIMLGFLATIDWRLTVISSNFVALLLIVSMAMTIHLIVRYRELNDTQPQLGQRDKIREMIASMFQPCLYTALTTMVAFVSLVVSGIRPVIDFGWMMVIGLSLAFMVSFILIPTGLLLLPETQSSKKEDRSSVFTLRFSRFTQHNGRLILVLGVLATIVSVVGIKQLKVENRFIDYFHSSTEIYQGMLVIDQSLGGTISLDIILDYSQESEFTVPVNVSNNADSEFATDDEFGADPFADDPFANVNTEDDFSSQGEFGGSDPFASESSKKQVSQLETYWFTQAGMEEIEQVHDYLDGFSEIGKVQSLAIAYKVARDLNGKSLNDFELALLRQALPEEINSFLVQPYLATDRDQTRISMRVKETDASLQRDELLRKIRTDLVEKFNFDAENVRLTGVLVLYNNLLQSLFKSQIMTIGAVFFGILLMFLILFRSLNLALIALIPNMLAALVVLGGMGLAGIPLDMMTITIAAIAVGIGVDDAVHYIYRYRKEFTKEKNYIKAMHAAHASIGRAMHYTSVTIILGFSILMFSKFIPSIYFGLLTGLAMLAAIVASLTLLPQFILMFKPLGEEEAS